jgi:hypothetical protein
MEWRVVERIGVMQGYPWGKVICDTVYRIVGTPRGMRRLFWARVGAGGGRLRSIAGQDKPVQRSCSVGGDVRMCVGATGWAEKKSAPGQGPEAVSGCSCGWSVGAAAAVKLAAQVECAGEVAGVNGVGLGSLPDGQSAGNGRFLQERDGKVHRAGEIGIGRTQRCVHTILLEVLSFGGERGQWSLASAGAEWTRATEG